MDSPINFFCRGWKVMQKCPLPHAKISITSKVMSFLKMQIIHAAKSFQHRHFAILKTDSLSFLTAPPSWPIKLEKISMCPCAFSLFTFETTSRLFFIVASSFRRNKFFLKFVSNYVKI